MAEERIFVGRKDELEKFGKVLEEAKGQAVLVVGQAGMGKTWLINEMAEVAENHPDLKCGWVRYEVTPTDSVDSTMALMMDEGFEAAASKIKKGIRLGGRSKQWSALLSAVGLIPVVGDKAKTIGELVMSLRREPTKDTRKQFIEKLNYINETIPENGRAIFVIDPEKYMQKESDQSWAIVVKQLPEKIKFVFAQRPGDALIDSETFDALDNVVRVPGERLGVLEEEAVDELLTLRGKGLKFTVTEVRKVLSRYEGHPYALGAALDLIKGGIKLEKLPEKPEPTKFAAVQWNRARGSGDGAIELFEAYAVLEVGVPDDVVEVVSGLKSAARKKLMADKYLRGLLREEGEGRRIYHAILADYILGQIGKGEKKDYHGRAVGVYREKLAEAKKTQTKPDALAAMRLAEHVLAAEGKEAFVDAFVKECTQPLLNLGLLDAAIALSERALSVVEKGSKEEAAVLGNLGLVYQTRGELDKAEEMHKKALEIDKKLGRLEGMARQYGNLGLIYQTRGELDKAEEMFREGLKIDERIGRLEGMATKYGNLGLIYKTRGDLDKAEEMHKKSLEIAEKLGIQEEIARQYGNLGLIYKSRGELDKAEEMFMKILDIHKKLGHKEGMALDYGNLGLIYGRRGDLDKAEEMQKKALEIDKKIGRLEGQALRYGNLGLIYMDRGDLDKAEEMFRDGLKIDEKLGRLEGMANQYGNLGNVYGTRGDLDKAEEMHKKALEIDEKLGLKEGMASDYGNLGVIYKQRGDIAKAKEYWEKALELYKKIGMPHMVEKVEGWIRGLKKS